MNKKANEKVMIGTVVIISSLIYSIEFLRLFIKSIPLLFPDIVFFTSALILVAALTLTTFTTESNLLVKGIKLVLIGSLLYLYVLPFIDGFYPLISLQVTTYNHWAIYVAVASIITLIIDMFHLD